MALPVGEGTVPIGPDFQSTNFQRKVQQEGDRAAGSMARSFDGAWSKITKAGLVAATAVTAALSKGLTEGLDVGKANDKLSAQLGATGKFSEDLGKVAGKLYANAYGDSLGQVNEALRGVRQQGLVTEDASNASMERQTAKVLDLATAFDQDLNQATAAAGTLLKTGLAKNADEAFDVMTRGFQQGVDKQGDFLETLIEYPTLFRELGLSAQSATGLLSQGLQAGARDSDKVADALKEFSVRAVDGSKLTAEGFDMLGLSGEKMARRIAKGGPDATKALDETLDRLRGIEDPVKRSQAAVALFGTQAEDLGDALYALDPSEAVKALGKVGGAAERMGDTLNDNAATRLEAFKRQGLQRLTEFATGGLDAIAGLADNIGPKLEPALRWFNNAKEAAGFLWENLRAGTLDAETFGDIMTLVVGDRAAGALERLAKIGGEALDGIREAFASFTAGLRGEGGPGSFFTDLGEGIAAFGRVALPIVEAVVGWIRDHLKPILIGLGVLVAGPLALAAGFVFLYQKFEGFRQAVEVGFAIVKAVVTTAIDVIAWLFREVLLPVLGVAVRFLTDTLWPAFRTVFDAAADIVKWAWANVIEPVFKALTWFLQTILIPAFQALMWVITRVVIPIVTAVIKDAWEIIKGIFGAIVWFLDVTLGNAFRAFAWVAGVAWDSISWAVGKAWGAIEPIFSAVWGFVKDKLTPVWEAMRGAAAAAWDALPGMIQGALRAIGGVIGGFLDGVGSIADAIGLDHIAEVLRNGARSARTWGQGPAPAYSANGIRVEGGQRRRFGGPIRGSGRGDHVKILAEPGEFMMRRDVVRQPGMLGFLSGLNDGRLGFRAGGLIPNPIDNLRGLADGVVDKVRGLGTRALEQVWRELPTDNGLLSFPAGGANYIRGEIFKLIRGKEQEMGSLSGGGFTRQGGGGPAGRYTAGMLKAKADILSRFGALGFGGYSNRNIAGTSTRSQHALWRAWDIMVGLGNTAKGNAIANFLIANAGQYGLKGLIWNDQKNFGTGWRPYGHPGGGRSPTEQHRDHVHAEFFDNGGVLEPGWNRVYNGLGVDEPLVPAGAAKLADAIYIERQEDVDLFYQRARFHGLIGAL